MNPENDTNVVEAVAVRFAGFLAGVFIFFYFLVESEGNQLYLFLSFIGLGLGLYLGFTAWKEIGLLKKVRDDEREKFR